MISSSAATIIPSPPQQQQQQQSNNNNTTTTNNANAEYASLMNSGKTIDQLIERDSKYPDLSELLRGKKKNACLKCLYILYIKTYDLIFFLMQMIVFVFYE